jgi:hypothetical protein
VSGGKLPPDLAAANRGPERELVCYPTGHLGLRLIDHTPFRGTEFCAADQFSVFVYCVFFYARKRFFNRFLKSAGTWLIFISYAFCSDRRVARQNIRQIDIVDGKEFVICSPTTDGIG